MHKTAGCCLRVHTPQSLHQQLSTHRPTLVQQTITGNNNNKSPPYGATTGLLLTETAIHWARRTLKQDHIRTVLIAGHTFFGVNLLNSQLSSHQFSHVTFSGRLLSPCTLRQDVSLSGLPVAVTERDRKRASCVTPFAHTTCIWLQDCKLPQDI